jgi:hypothetical protein
MLTLFPSFSWKQIAFRRLCVSISYVLSWSKLSIVVIHHRTSSGFIDKIKNCCFSVILVGSVGCALGTRLYHFQVPEHDKVGRVAEAQMFSSFGFRRPLIIIIVVPWLFFAEWDMYIWVVKYNDCAVVYFLRDRRDMFK